ncbi:MAG: Methylase involved in ubiquinone/menaquinone biosynthesis [Acidimicrobiales bacterium]|nr:Methylase involved in ubiquinone/menaquinone biosynthesis [Acidimicrobiales bacterium]
MFNVEFLHVIREFEYVQIIKRLPAGASILEIGGGTGYQAKRLTQDGYQVTSIDIPDSNYAGQHEFPVQPYDGRHIPFPDHAFDVVFSSNVLEHVRQLDDLQLEIKRVLRPGGVCVHLMPTGAWRLWTNVAHYTELLQRLAGLAPRLWPRGLSRHALRDVLSVVGLMAGTTKHYLIVPRHGETGNALSEIATFSARHWRQHFNRQNFQIDEVSGVGLFYTGHMVLGKHLALHARQRLAGILGSACVIYVVRPLPDSKRG